jgi:hypothetical protein
LRYHIDKLKCKDCQKHKLAGRGRTAPWEEVAIDLIGPWKVKVNGQQVEFHTLTCIDMASNLLNTYVTSSHKVGIIDTLTLYNVYMTR